jgi:hypothetical protein
MLVTRHYYIRAAGLEGINFYPYNLSHTFFFYIVFSHVLKHIDFEISITLVTIIHKCQLLDVCYRHGEAASAREYLNFYRRYVNSSWLSCFTATQQKRRSCNISFAWSK